ncbi:hypothetical protein ACIBBD_26700 [Streptomyces sp. NPDC051315]|uniref:hypothetical protein n=1 Tax=Streptomyces sp. NPDC051315 TaxID=3365650 RepID=UPI0037A91BF8
MSAGRWGTGVGAVVVLVGTGAWVLRPAPVDARLWAEVRPVIEARLVAESRGSGLGESTPALRARWFCRAEALDLEERAGRVRAGVDTLCMEYGVRDGALVECSGAHVPQVVRLERDTDGDGYRVVAREQAPDGAGNAEWEETHFSYFAESRLGEPESPGALESAAREHFRIPAGTPVGDC